MDNLRIALLAIFVFSFSFLQGTPIVCSDDLRDTLESYLSDYSDLSPSDAAKQLESYLRQNGYPFAQAKVGNLYGRKVVSIKEGKIGEARVAGNKHLSTKGILKNLGWNSGDSFNYGKFQRQAAQLNRNRFILVDTKLSPKRADDGEVIVDADFKVKDSVPISGNLDISNNGTPQSSGWRSKLGLEMWEPFSSSDRISFSYLTDPKEASELQSYSLAYQASYGV